MFWAGSESSGFLGGQANTPRPVESANVGKNTQYHSGPVEFLKKMGVLRKSTDCDPPGQELLLGLTGTAHVQCIDLHSAFRIARGPCMQLVRTMSSADAGRTYRLAPRTLNVMNTLRNVVAMGDVLRVLYHRPSGPRLSDGLRGGQLAAMLRVHIARARGTNTKATHAH